MSEGRPSQKNQTSRKGKKAWRKNIDLDEFEQGLDDKRESEIVLGPQPLFSVDTQGDNDALTKSMKAEKRLRTYEILRKRSAIGELPAVHKKKDQPKPKPRSAASVRDLLRASGRTGESTAKFSVERDGVVRSSGTGDVWGDEPTPEARPTNSVSRATPAKPRLVRAPQAPLPDAKAVSVPDEGRSYNPSLDAWKATINAEHTHLEKIEREKEQARAEQERIEAILAAESEHESENESESAPENDAPSTLSVNAPVKNKKKTRQQINRQRRHREREQMHARLRQIKSQISELEQLPKLVAEVNAKPEKPEGQEKKPRALNRAHSKHPVMEEPFAIKLSEELDDSLRRLRPEGNLAKERFRSLQARGLIEARVPLTKKDKTKARRRVTEKWTHKDVRL